jgi:soluble lytic murein transglycosylase
MTLSITNILKLCYILSSYYEIPPEILPAMIRVESDFKQTAVSHKGAVGLMQITEPAFNCFVRANPKHRIKHFSQMKTSWEDNIRVGAWYLKRRCYQGDWKDAISSYFWGINSTRKTDTYYNKVKEAQK